MAVELYSSGIVPDVRLGSAYKSVLWPLYLPAGYFAHISKYHDDVLDFSKNGLSLPTKNHGSLGFEVWCCEWKGGKRDLRSF